MYRDDAWRSISFAVRLRFSFVSCMLSIFDLPITCILDAIFVKRVAYN